MNCPKCGKEVNDGVKFCDHCGAPLENSEHNNIIKWKDDEENKIICMLAYLGILFFLPLVVDPQSQAGRYHANQGLVLLLVSIAGHIILGILSFVLWFLSWLIGLLSAVWSIVIFIFMIQGMMNAYKCERKPLPYIGHIQIIK